MDGGWIGKVVEVEVEAPAGSFVKRDPRGAIDVISPVPLPWNYGFVVGHQGGDGDPLDAILVGRRRRAGARWVGEVVGVVDFRDAGCEDLKLICGDVGRGDRLAIRAFFMLYPLLKRGLYRYRGETGETGVRQIRWARDRR